MEHCSQHMHSVTILAQSVKCIVLADRRAEASVAHIISHDRQSVIGCNSKAHAETKHRSTHISCSSRCSTKGKCKDKRHKLKKPMAKSESAASDAPWRAANAGVPRKKNVGPQGPTSSNGGGQASSAPLIDVKQEDDDNQGWVQDGAGQWSKPSAPKSEATGNPYVDKKFSWAQASAAAHPPATGDVGQTKCVMCV